MRGANTQDLPAGFRPHAEGRAHVSPQPRFGTQRTRRSRLWGKRQWKAVSLGMQPVWYIQPKQAPRVQDSPLTNRRWIMPGGDRTGPMGMGPMTGRGAGFCTGFSQPGATTPVFGPRGGFGRGRGCGPGFGRGPGRGRFRGMMPGPNYGYGPGPTPAMSPDQEKNMLQQEAKSLREALSALENRIAELENQDTGST